MNNYAIELLKDAGYTMVQIMAMTESQRRNLALEIEAELERIEMEA